MHAITARVDAPQHPLLTPVFPRFTPQEILILNYIVSGYPHPVETEDILRYLERSLLGHPVWGGPSRSSLQVAIASIRAKLGEKKWKPSRLTGVFSLKANGSRDRLIGYAWRG